MTYRNLHIDTLRGFACLLLVSYHVVGSDTNVGLKIDAGFLREFNDALSYLRMPLFTFLSGIVYAYRPYQSDPITYTKGKIRRLLVPMLIIGTIFALLRSVTSTADQAAINLSTIHIYPVAHFWFVEAIFLIFLSMIILEKFKLFFNLKRAMAVMIVACGFYLAGTNIKIFSLDGAVYLFPFFIAGMILQRYKLIGNQHFLLTPLLFIAGLLTLAFVLINIPQAEPKFTFPSLAIGLLLCSALVLTKLKNTFLAKIGTYSYTIYIFHVFFTAASRIGLNKLGIQQIEVLFILGLFLGIAGPILTELIFNKTKITRTLFLGKKGI